MKPWPPNAAAQHIPTPIHRGSRVVKAISAQVGRDCSHPSCAVQWPCGLGCFLASLSLGFLLGVPEAELELAASVAGLTSRDTAQTGLGGSQPCSNAGAVLSPLGESGSEAAGSSRAEVSLCRQWVGEGLRMSSTQCEPRCTGHSDRNTLRRCSSSPQKPEKPHGQLGCLPSPSNSTRPHVLSTIWFPAPRGQ